MSSEEQQPKMEDAKVEDVKTESTASAASPALAGKSDEEVQAVKQKIVEQRGSPTLTRVIHKLTF